jgi:hypothetical protein
MMTMSAGITLIVVVVFSLLVIVLRPSYALAAYITVLLWYPHYLVLMVGAIHLPASRIVVLVLLLRCLYDNQIRSKFIWSRLDTWVTLSVVVYVGAFLITRPFSESIINRGGFLFDTWFAYIVARLIITDRPTLTIVIKCISVVLAPLAILGAIEAITSWKPFFSLCQNSEWFYHWESYEARWGLTRAIGPFSHSILFGCCFAMFLPLIYYLRHQKRPWNVLAYVFSGTALVGCMSSMSSGSWMMIIVVILCLVMEKHAAWIKPAFIGFGLLCILIAVVSNRPFYHVIVSYANPIGGEGWHRAKLIDLAISHFGEWWLLGYGGRDPGWGSDLGMEKTDVTNQFILNGVEYGVLGIIALCGVLATAFGGVIRMYKRTGNPELKSLYWSLGSVQFSVIVTWMSVSFFGQMISLFYIILGMIGSSIGFVTNEGRNFQRIEVIPQRFKM